MNNLIRMWQSVLKKEEREGERERGKRGKNERKEKKNHVFGENNVPRF